jgi:Putative restriction endonuclease
MAAPTTTRPIPEPTPLPAPTQWTPPLENGDQLTRDEFERRYAAMPEVKKAELIEGVVYMGSPVRADGHGEQHLDLVTLFGVYKIATPGVRAADNATVRLDLDNEPQPDAALYVDPACGGQCRLTDGYITNGPELVGEIASSSVSIDLGIKFHVYRRNGVREYIVWRVRDRAIDWFILPCVRQCEFTSLILSMA